MCNKSACRRFFEIFIAIVMLAIGFFCIIHLILSTHYVVTITSEKAEIKGTPMPK